MKFSIYGSNTAWAEIDLLELLQMQSTDGDLWAHAETSGCESCYVEVARWNHAAQQWQRFCFFKIDGWRFPEIDDCTDGHTAELLARRINSTTWQARAAVVHRMPNWAGAEVTAAS